MLFLLLCEIVSSLPASLQEKEVNLPVVIGKSALPTVTAKTRMEGEAQQDKFDCQGVCHVVLMSIQRDSMPWCR